MSSRRDGALSSELRALLDAERKLEDMPSDVPDRMLARLVAIGPGPSPCTE